jgi:hypothetical protein
MKHTLHNNKMLLTLIALGISFILTLSCSDNTPKVIAGYYKDTSGLGFLHLYPLDSSKTKYWLGNSQGHLVGIRQDNTVKGITALQDSFSFEWKGDYAIYTIMGISSDYYPIPESQFEKAN